MSSNEYGVATFKMINSLLLESVQFKRPLPSHVGNQIAEVRDFFVDIDDMSPLFTGFPLLHACEQRRVGLQRWEFDRQQRVNIFLIAELRLIIDLDTSGI